MLTLQSPLQLQADAEVCKPAVATIRRAKGPLCPTIWFSGRFAGYAKFCAATARASHFTKFHAQE